MTDWKKRFVDQAHEGYVGTAMRIARDYDACGEVHVVVEMVSVQGTHYLDWLGAEDASEPDELGDELPADSNYFPRRLSWESLV